MDPDLYRDTSKTCLDGAMHCPSASSCMQLLNQLSLLTQLACNKTTGDCLQTSHFTCNDAKPLVYL